MTRSRSNSIASNKSASSQKRKIDLDKIEVYLEYSCFICGIVLGGPRTSIDHVKKIHGYILPPRPKDQKKRPRHHRYFYVRDKSGPYTIVENACPSCWFHSPEDDLEALNEHIREEHNPIKVKKEDDVKQEKRADDRTVSDDTVKKEKKKVDHRSALHQQPVGDKKQSKAVSFVNSDHSRNKKEEDENVAKDLAKKFEEMIILFKNLFTSSS